jgi:phage tail-like protein
MANLRDRPYVQFNFQVELGIGNEVDGGFQECSNIGMEVTVAEYRNGNSPDNHVLKLTGLNKCTDVTLKRGVIGSLSLYNWLDGIRKGQGNENDSNQTARRTVTIRLMPEDQTKRSPSDAALTWTLSEARIIKYVCGPLNAKGTDVAMEELTLSYEELTMA